MDDDQCIKAYLKGDIAAFETVYERYRDKLYGYFYRSCSTPQVADELFQDVWIKVLVSLDRYADKGRFRSWLFVCAHNVVVDHYRKKSIDSDHEAVEQLSERPAMDELDLAERIDTALNKLPLDQKQAFFLREELGCSLKDIAEIQGCGLEAAKSRLRYAYAKLREQLEDLATE